MLGRPLGSLYLCELVLKTGLGFHTFPQMLFVRKDPSKAQSKESGIFPNAAPRERLKRAADLKREKAKKPGQMVQIIIQATKEIEAREFPKQFSPS